MRVICISEGSGPNGDAYMPPIIVGNPYNVKSQEVLNDGKMYYELHEIPPDHFFRERYLYACYLFAVPSEIDETELINHKEEVV